MPLKFTLTTVRGRQVDVVVHGTRRQMRRAAQRWNGAALAPDVRGVTQGFTQPCNPQAVVRINQQDLSRRVIDHELVHAAQAIYGHDYGEAIEAHPLEHWTHFNETFAFTVTELQAAIYTALAAHGLEPGISYEEGQPYG